MGRVRSWGARTIPPTCGRSPPVGGPPDATGLTRDLVNGPTRLFSILTGTRHVLLVYVSAAADVAAIEEFCATAAATAHGALDCYLITGADAGPDAAVDTVLPVLHDTAGAFADAYSPTSSPAASPAPTAVHLVRPDGYLSFVSAGLDTSALVRNLELTFAAR